MASAGRIIDKGQISCDFLSDYNIIWQAANDLFATKAEGRGRGKMRKRWRKGKGIRSIRLKALFLIDTQLDAAFSAFRLHYYVRRVCRCCCFDCCCWCCCCWCCGLLCGQRGCLWGGFGRFAALKWKFSIHFDTLWQTLVLGGKRR